MIRRNDNTFTNLVIYLLHCLLTIVTVVTIFTFIMIILNYPSGNSYYYPNPFVKFINEFYYMFRPHQVWWYWM